MRRFDKKKNIQKINLLAEQRYLQSKGLLKENNMFEEPMQQGQSNEDYVKDFLYNFKEMETVIDSDSDTLFVEFKTTHDDEDSTYWVDIDFDIIIDNYPSFSKGDRFTPDDYEDGSVSLKISRIIFNIGWDDENEEFLKTFKVTNPSLFNPITEFFTEKFNSSNLDNYFNGVKNSGSREPEDNSDYRDYLSKNDPRNFGGEEERY
jgi:hypothetical protein